MFLIKIKKKGKVIHCKQEAYDVYIGRPGKWGNPFPLTKYSRTESIERYRQWILKRPELISDLRELKGKVLGCWCKPLACHGDVLLKLIKKFHGE